MVMDEARGFSWQEFCSTVWLLEEAHRLLAVILLGLVLILDELHNYSIFSRIYINI